MTMQFNGETNEEWVRQIRKVLDMDTKASVLLWRADMYQFCDRLERTEREVARLREAVLDIDMHATPEYTADETVQAYIISAGSLHRALGVVGHTAPKWQTVATQPAAEAGVTTGWRQGWDRLLHEYDDAKATDQREPEESS